MGLIDQIKLLSNSTNEALIQLLIDKTKVELSTDLKKDYSNVFDNVLVDIVVIKLNRIGTEGLASQGYSGVSESYLNEYPDYIMKQLNAFRKRVGFL